MDITQENCILQSCLLLPMIFTDEYDIKAIEWSVMVENIKYGILMDYYNGS